MMSRAACWDTRYLRTYHCPVGTSINDQIRPADRRKGFAEKTGGKCPAVAERPCCIEEQDIKVSLETKVLIAVIQQKYIRLESFESLKTGPVPVGSGYDNKAGNRACQENRLISSLRDGKKYSRTVRNDADFSATCTTITAGQEGNAFSPGNELTCYQD
jgi:hypothetical protein